MANRMGAFWRGQIFFVARSNQISRFVNEALRDRVVLFQAQKSETGLRARVSLQDFHKLRRAARASRTQVRIAAKYGLPFIIGRWRRRKGLLTGIILIAFTLVVLAQLVLSVTVSGNHRVKTEEILTQAAGLGLKPWVWQQKLDLNAIAKHLQEQNPGLAWVGVERKGTRVEIKVVEKVSKTTPVEGGNLVAAKTGYVQDIMVIQGVAQVHEGELVRPGQVLIAQAPPPGGPGIDKQAKPAAKGFVRGRVWYSAESIVPLNEDKIEESGRQANGWGIKIWARVIMVTMPQSPFAQSIQEVQSRSLFSWRNWRFPVEIINVKYKELQNNHYERTATEARQIAESQARAVVYGKAASGVTPLEEAVKVLPGPAGTAKVRLELETYEDLAVYQNS